MKEINCSRKSIDDVPLWFTRVPGNPDIINQLATDERFRLLKTDTVLMLNEVMNAKFQIQGKETTTDMCYAIQKIEERAAVNAVVEAERRLSISEHTILDDIMNQFKLTLEDAKAYMAGKLPK